MMVRKEALQCFRGPIALSPVPRWTTPRLYLRARALYVQPATGFTFHAPSTSSHLMPRTRANPLSRSRLPPALGCRLGKPSSFIILYESVFNIFSSPLSNEAMDEFLSILRPSLPAFFPPSSPGLRSYMPNSMPGFGHERSISLKLSRLEIGKDAAAFCDEDIDTVRSGTPSRSSNRSDADDEASQSAINPNMMSMAADITGRWFRSAILCKHLRLSYADRLLISCLCSASPVSRSRNPFNKNITNRAITPRAHTPLSPAAIPLPSTPDPSLEA